MIAEDSDLKNYNFALERDTLSSSLGGGIPEGSIVLITGKFSTGKSVVCQRFTYGFVENGACVTYVSSETNTKPFIKQMISLDYPVKNYVHNHQLKFVPVDPLIGGSCPRTENLSRLVKSKGLYERDITVIDTMSSMIGDNQKQDLPVEALTYFKKICSRGKSLFLTLDPDEVDEDIITPYKSAADIHLELKRETIGNEVQRTIHVRRFTTAVGRMQEIIKFRIEPNAGFIVDITQVS